MNWAVAGFMGTAFLLLLIVILLCHYYWARTEGLSSSLSAKAIVHNSLVKTNKRKKIK